MFNTVYRLVAPRRFETAFQNIDLKSGDVLVKPEYLSICHADQRYYQGLRKPEVLRKKLPMALIHEGIGTVVYDPNGEFLKGQRVVMIPNQPMEQDTVIGENYLRSSHFCSSGYDGFMRDYVELKPDRLVKLSDKVSNEVGAFIELVSVSYHAVMRMEQFSHRRRRRIGIWGDGNLGFITSLIVKTLFPEREVVILGVNREKLTNFTFADETYLTDELPDDFWVDHGIECVGGIYAAKAINQIIDVIQPEGTISLLGVSEVNVDINTRMVLEKGLRIFGSSRSGRKAFEGVVAMLEQNPVVAQYLETLIARVVDINQMSDITKAFELDQQKNMGKTVMKWNV